MNLMIQPGDGLTSLLAGINGAQKSIEIAIFRFDLAEIEKALKQAVARGVSVSALIAYTNRGGETKLRRLEMRLLEMGVTVSRTAADLLRYHNKMMIVDRSILYVLSYNFTHLDIDHSRGFGVTTTNSKLVQEAAKLFEADSNPQPYTADLKEFVVSPVNARDQLKKLITGAEKELLIYDPKIDDPEMTQALAERAQAGVHVRIIGTLKKKIDGVEVKPLAGLRLHTRTIVSDRRQVFLGSQSLRRAELDLRREVGLITGDAKAVSGICNTFDSDWERNPQELPVVAPRAKVIKKTVKALVKAMAPLSPAVENAVREAVEGTSASLDPGEVKETVAAAVKEAVRDHVKELVKQAVEAP